MLDRLLILLAYFGALVLPLGYGVLTRGRGPAIRRVLLGFALQSFWSLAVWALVWGSWRAGDADYWMCWALLLPINLVGYLYFFAALFWPPSGPRT